MAMRHTLFLLAPVLALGLVSCNPLEQPKKSDGSFLSRAKPVPKLTLRLSSGSTLLKRQEWPNIQVELVHNGTRSLKLLRPALGSALGLRTPRVAWSVREESDPRPHQFTSPKMGAFRCGNIPALAKEDFLQLTPGETVSIPVNLTSLVFPSAGVYRVKLAYQNLPQADWEHWRMLAPVEDALWAAMKATDRVELVSNELIFQVVE